MHEGHEALPLATEETGRIVVDAALRVHRTLGPGLLESAYEACLEHELRQAGQGVARQVELPLAYGELKLSVGYRIDLIVNHDVLVEVKAVERMAPIHDQQLLTYLRLSGRRLGFLINFNTPTLKQGLRRKIL